MENLQKTVAGPLEVENTTPKDVIDLKSPQPAKKLVQARLPFKVLSPKPVTTQPVSSSAQKKRKLSDQTVGQQKASKAPKAEDSTTQKSVKKSKSVDDAENEVSSSSEADLHKTKPAENKSHTVSLLDKFLRTTQAREVSTSSEANVIDVHESENEAEGNDVSMVDTQSREAEDSEDSKSSITHKLLVSVTKVDKDAAELHLSQETKKDEEDDLDLDESVLEKSIVSINDSIESMDVSACSSLSEDDEGGESSSESKNEVTGSDGVVKNTSKGLHPSRKKDLTDAQKEQRRLERQKQKEVAKADKEKERKDKKEQREQERLSQKKKKDEEKQKLLDLKQKEKEDKLKQKEEERKKKQLEKDEDKKKKQLEKDEEKKKKQDVMDAKNEGKRKKDEDKLKGEVEAKQKNEKEKAMFSKFFCKTEKQPVTKTEGESKSRFIAFEVKKDMRVAPMRVTAEQLQEKRGSLDEHKDKELGVEELYLQELKEKKIIPGVSSKTWPYENDVEILDVNAKLMRAKFLKFRENHRPAYYGTWRKTSIKIKARTPLVKDEGLLDYEVDSDDEWEEEEPGESLSDSEGEAEAGEGDGSEDKDEEDEEDADGFFVPHGYLSEGEGCEDEDDEVSPERLKARQLAKAKAWETECESTKFEVLTPVCIGCCWWTPDTADRDPTWSKLKQFTAVPLRATPILVGLADSNDANSPSGKNSADQKKKDAGPKLMTVPDEAMPDLIRLVHGNIWSIQKLIKEFREYWRRKTLGLSLRNSEDDAKTQEDGNQEKQVDKENSAVSDQLDTSQSETDKNTPKQNSDSDKFTISKRQLHVKIHDIACYEKQASYEKQSMYNRAWYVHKELIEKHNLADLPVPTQWHWLTRSNLPKKSKKVKPPKENGNPVVQQPKNHCQQPSNTRNITEFAVPGYTPPVLTPVTPKSAQKDKVSQIPISALLCTTPKSSPSIAPTGDSTPKQVGEAPSVVTPDTTTRTPVRDEGKGGNTPKDRSQRTLLTMFSPPPAKKAKIDSPSPSHKPVSPLVQPQVKSSLFTKPRAIVSPAALSNRKLQPVANLTVKPSSSQGKKAVQRPLLVQSMMAAVNSAMNSGDTEDTPMVID